MSNGSSDTGKRLREQLVEIKSEMPVQAKFKLHEAFTAWFAATQCAKSIEEAIESLTGRDRDKGIDALHIDESNKVVSVIQGKYHSQLGGALATREVVLHHSEVVGQALVGPRDEFEKFLDNMSARAKKRAQDARKSLERGGFSLRLYFATTGRCSAKLAKEAEESTDHLSVDSGIKLDDLSFEVVADKGVRSLWKDWEDGVAPAVPEIKLQLDSAPSKRSGKDGESEIDSWAFAVSGDQIARAFERTGRRIFARNIRGFLGSTAVNEAMVDTLSESPGKFLYLNNGLTIICEDAWFSDRSSPPVFIMKRPQIVNGQQTSRVLHQEWKRSSKRRAEVKKANVEVRVLSLSAIRAKSGTDTKVFDALLEEIVEATNNQNPIKKKDLRSNDSVQIAVERDLKQNGFFYIRKSAAQSEIAPARNLVKVKREDLVKSIGVSLGWSPYREQDKLWESPRYERIFEEHSSIQLLAVWLLANQVRRKLPSPRDPVLVWGQWVAFRQIWSSVGENILTEPEIFVREMTQGGGSDLSRAVDTATGSVLPEVKSSYRRHRGKGLEQLDVQVYFKRFDESQELFTKDWRKASSSRRGAYNKAITKARKVL